MTNNFRHTGHWSLAPAIVLAGFAALALIAALATAVSAQSGSETPKPTPLLKEHSPATSQTVHGFPLTVTVEDSTQMDIRYRSDQEYQFYGHDAEGVYLWVNVGGETKVYGPGAVPAGLAVNPYTPVSNSTVGVGSPDNPWKITTVVSVPDTTLRLTQISTYVNGAEFVHLDFQLEQIGGSTPMTATLFHAADLYTGGSDVGFGYYDSSTGGVGDYYTRTDNTVLYQQFVPATPADAYMEARYSTIWTAIGNTNGPGSGFNNTIISDTQHDAAAGLQWNLTVPSSGNVTVGDTDLFSPHQSLCGSFSDVPYGSFNYEYIYYLACNGIVGGYNDTTFRPNNPITRGQLSKMVSNSAGWMEDHTEQTFEDVPTTSAFYLFIERMASRGYISGYDCGGPGEPCVGPGNRPYFRPNANATRGQISKIIANAKGWTEDHTEQTFQDVAVGSTFYQYIERMASRGIIGGYQCGSPGEPCVPPDDRAYFRPNANATRGQVSKMVGNAFFPGCCGAAKP